MLVKSAHFLEMYVLRHVVITVMFVTSASSAFLASSVLKTELIILNMHIYFCVFQ